MADPTADAHNLLANITAATAQLSGALDDAGLIRQMRQAPSCSLQGLDRGLPRHTLDDLLAACEAFAIVTGPTALAQDDHLTLHDEAGRLLATLQGIERASGRRTRSGRTAATTITLNASLMREALGAPAVKAALRRLIAAFAALVELREGERSPTGGWLALLPLGARLLMPGVVVVITLALVVGLLGAALVARHDPARAPVGSATLQAHATAAPTHAKTAPAPTAPPARPTPTATAVSVAPAPQLVAVSGLDQSPCTGGPDGHFTVTFTSGPGTVHWSATPGNAAAVALSVDGANFGSQVSGTLTAGQQATVTVRALQDGASQVNVTTSAGAFTVVVDTQGC